MFIDEAKDAAKQKYFGDAVIDSREPGRLMGYTHWSKGFDAGLKFQHDRLEIAIKYLREIAKPALGGKAQQYAAQEALTKLLEAK